MPHGARSFTLAALLLLAACGGTESTGAAADSALMRPGEDCLSCHDGSNPKARVFTAAGTVYGSADAAASAGLSGATVTITGPNGQPLTLTTNSAGNFYTTADFGSGASVTVRQGTSSHAMNGTISSTSRTGCAASICHPAGTRVHVP